MKLSNTFELIAEQMIRELEFIKEGPGELKGKSREIILHRFLKPFIPDDMGICTGVVISKNNESGEIDLIIHDKKTLSLFGPFFNHYPNDLRPIPCETVYAVIEIENKLNETKAQRCIRRIGKVKKLPKSAYFKQSGAIIHTFNLYGKEWEYFPTLGIVFAFDGNPIKVIKAIKHANFPLEHGIDLVCLLKKGLITYLSQENKLLFPPEPDSNLVFLKGSPKENLEVLYLLLTRVFSQAWTRPIRVIDYFR